MKDYCQKIQDYLANITLDARNKKIISLVVILFLVLSGFWCFGLRTPAYAVIIDGQERFTVADRGAVHEALNSLRDKQQKGFNGQLEDNFRLKRVLAKRDDIVPANQVKPELAKVLKFQTLATAIMVNGKKVAYVESRKVADELLQKLKSQNSQVEQGEKLLSAGFKEKVEFKEEKVTLDKVFSPEGVWNLITTGTDCPERYTIKEGDNLWSIARKNNMYVSDIVNANNLREDDLLALGQEIILIKSKPYINVVAQVEGNKTEIIPFQTKVITDSRSTSSVKVRSAGENGEKKISYKATRINGVIDKKEVISEETIKHPVDRVVVKGSRIVYLASRSGGGSGNLEWPVYGPINQYYHSGHTGIDIGGGVGTPIRAAESGRVTFAGYQGNYGKFVVLQHDNGMVTRYAHCSTISVTVGQRVSRGESIAARGSTGRSTGPHLHFEVLDGGSFRNPLNYLR